MGLEPGEETTVAKIALEEEAHHLLIHLQEYFGHDPAWGIL